MTPEQQIRNIAAKLRISERKAWNMYFETGHDYIELLKKAIIHFSVFKKQFGSLIDNGSLNGLTVPETFRQISVAPDFWAWWLGQLWNSACGNYQFQTIPTNIITKIFTNEKTDTRSKNRHQSKARTASKPAHENQHA